MRRRAAWLLLALFMLAGARAVAAERTPDDQLVVARDLSQIATLDPGASGNTLANQLILQLYDTLLAVDPADPARFVPVLAESWEVGERHLTLHMRPEARFADGRPVTAGDAAFSLIRVVRLARGAESALIGLGITAATVETAVTAPDDRTLEISWPAPIAPQIVLYVLTTANCAIVQRRVALEHAEGSDQGAGWLATHSAGSGPFALARWRPSEIVAMVRVEPGWRRRPSMRRILFQHVAEPGVRALLARLGDADLASDLTTADAESLDGVPGVVVEHPEIATLLYLALNQKVPLLARPGVAEAFKWLIDYDGLGRSVLAGQAKPWQSYVPQGSFAALDIAPYRLDVARARALLRAAGVAEGTHLKLLTTAVPVTLDIAQALQARAAEAGLVIEIERMVGAQLWPLLRARQYDAVLAAWSASYPDPHTTTESLILNPDNGDRAQLSGRIGWRAAWKDPALEALGTEAAALTDPVRRAALYAELQTGFAARAPIAIIAQSSPAIARRTRVTGLVQTPFGIDYRWVEKR